MLPFEETFKKAKSVLILGFGKEGRATYAFLRKYFPNLQTGIADRNTALAKEPLTASLHLGKDYLKAISGYEIVMKSPGVFLENVQEKEKAKITSQTDLVLQAFSKKIIGITGTKGKSTTASLVYHLLKKTGKHALLMGNIGFPAFNFIEEIEKADWIVYELSAHQLEMVHASPHIAVLLNVFPEHLDYFRTYEQYRKAKMNIFYFQQPGDSAFCGEDIPEATGCETIEEELNASQPDNLLQLSGLAGEHNLRNIQVAFRVLQKLGTPPEDLPPALAGFQALPHRLEYLGNFGGVSFYNDSISTVPQATIAAVKSIPQVDTLILGGFDRGIDYSELVAFLAKTPIKNFFFLGKAGERMLQLFGHWNTHKNLLLVNSLQDVFAKMVQLPKVSCCLLSPAAASYDQFHNFEHRGDLFKQLAIEYGKGREVPPE